MSRKWWVAAAAGLLAGGIALHQMKLAEQRVTGGEKVAVLVLNRSLAAGSAISAGALGVRHVPSAWVDERTIREKNRAETAGLVLSVGVDAGQMLQWSDFDERRTTAKNDLATEIPAGQRAMTIPVTGALSLGGLLRPGHRVDILGTFSSGKTGGKEKVTRMLLQDIRVLAIGADMHGDSGDARYSTVTLSVGVKQGEILAFAAGIGTLSLVLRGYEDTRIATDLPEIREADIIAPNDALREAAVNPAAPIEHLRVRR